MNKMQEWNLHKIDYPRTPFYLRFFLLYDNLSYVNQFPLFLQADYTFSINNSNRVNVDIPNTFPDYIPLTIISVNIDNPNIPISQFWLEASSTAGSGKRFFVSTPQKTFTGKARILWCKKRLVQILHNFKMDWYSR